ncbi:hypothetical protein HDV02_006040 [Globomyces sp. JEL0801]|nr:hypothetical protein HDV02_006040 [Globomyces sp. JEL0801]
MEPKNILLSGISVDVNSAAKLANIHVLKDENKSSEEPGKETLIYSLISVINSQQTEIEILNGEKDSLNSVINSQQTEIEGLKNCQQVLIESKNRTIQLLNFLVLRPNTIDQNNPKVTFLETKVNLLVETISARLVPKHTKKTRGVSHSINGVGEATLKKVGFHHVVNFSDPRRKGYVRKEGGVDSITLTPLEIKLVSEIFALLLLCKEEKNADFHWRHILECKEIEVGSSKSSVTEADIQAFFKRTLNSQIASESILKFVQTLKEDEKNDMIKNALTNIIEVEEKGFEELDQEMDSETPKSIEEQVKLEVKKKTQQIDALIKKHIKRSPKSIKKI